MEKLTLKEVVKRVKHIENISSDDEAAHCEEDDLFYDFVENIVEGNYETKEEIKKIATALFEVRSIGFSRWHA